MVSSTSSAEVVVVGAGLIGLSVARALAAEGLGVTLIGAPSAGEASPASAGMLAPSVERSSGPAHDFAVASRDRFPAFLQTLEEETGKRVSLNRLGILQLALTAAGVKGLKKSLLPGAEWLDDSALHKLEPTLAHGLGAVYSPNDGCVDNVELLVALRAAVEKSPVRIVEEKVVAVEQSASSTTARTDSGNVFAGDKLVIAAGAWSSTISGIAFGKHVRPSKGQMLAYASSPIRHVVYGPRGYLVPRENGYTLAGSTMEDVGFETNTTAEGIAKISSVAEEICPAFSSTRPDRAWAGLRPVTPDLLPLIGADPNNPQVVYACGHSRNGVLLAPLTGEIVADLVVGRGVAFDLTQFRPDRFQY